MAAYAFALRAKGRWLPVAVCAVTFTVAAPGGDRWAAAGDAEVSSPPVVALSGDSTLAQWQAATAAERSRVAVALARNRLEPTADKLAIATTAMEITGCVSATARDTKLQSWKVAPTATTCLTAREKPGK